MNDEIYERSELVREGTQIQCECVRCAVACALREMSFLDGYESERAWVSQGVNTALVQNCELGLKCVQQRRVLGTRR